MTGWKPRMARTRGEVFLWSRGWPSRRKDGYCYPVKGGHRRTGGKSHGGTLEKKQREVVASHHQACCLGCCEDLGGMQLWERKQTMVSILSR